MKKIIKNLSLFATMAVATIGIVSCNNGGTTNNSNKTDAPTNTGTATSKPSTTFNPTNTDSAASKPSTKDDSNLVTYKIRTVSISGKSLKDVEITVNGESEYTDINGYATFKFEKSLYSVTAGDLEGYTLESDEDIFVDPEGTDETVIKYVPHLITKDEAEAPSDITYEQGDVMYDLTFSGYDYTSSNGLAPNYKNPTAYNSSLSEILNDGETELVILNFWYADCTWCKREFPYMIDAYNAKNTDGSYTYKDKVKIITVNTGADEDSVIKRFAEEYSFVFPAIKDTALCTMFNVTAAPTSVFIDRYGLVGMIEKGAITSIDKWYGVFDEYIGDNYEPSYTDPSNEEYADAQGSMEDSVKYNDAVSGDGFNAEYYIDENRNDLNKCWPWLISEDTTGRKYIYPSNHHVNLSYSIIYAKFNMPANKILAFDYYSDCEDGDILGVFINGKVFYQISGNEKKWKTQYIYATQNSSEEVELRFFYHKDKSSSIGEDMVKISNIRIVEESSMTNSLFVIRDAAYGEIDKFNGGWTNYITDEGDRGIFFNDKDGYYHVDSINGPLLLASLLDKNTKFANKSIAEYLAEFSGNTTDNPFIVDGIDYSNIITTYATYATNSLFTIWDVGTNGLVPVTQDLREALEAITKSLGDTKDGYENQWLELCVFIDQYGTKGKDLIGDPIKGIAPFSAYEAKVGEDNTVNFLYPVVPRGMYSKFVPTQSGVYKIYSIGDDSIEFFFNGGSGSKGIFRDNFQLLTETKSENAVIEYRYYEAGKTYYILPAFSDVDGTGEIKFGIKYVGENATLLAQASEGAFTTDSDHVDTDHIISVANVEVAIDGENYYYVKGNPGSYIYADFKYVTGIFSNQSLDQIIAAGGFDFSKDEGNGTTGEDMTALAQYYSGLQNTDPNSIYYGTVKVDATLMNLLQKLMDKYTFANVSGSWLKLCYYEVQLFASNH